MRKELRAPACVFTLLVVGTDGKASASETRIPFDAHFYCFHHSALVASSYRALRRLAFCGLFGMPSYKFPFFFTFGFL